MNKLAEIMDLNGKTAIVTGGAKGIGQAICYRLAEAGANVIVADLDSESAQQTVKNIESHGFNAVAIQVDVSDESSVANLIQNCRDNFGSVDILVNNAGIFPVNPLTTMTPDDFDKVIKTNLYSVFFATKHASDIMMRQKSGKIINITSIDALHPSMIGLAHYDASKHGVWGFTKNVALELAPFGISVNAVAPGGVITPGVEAMSSGDSQTNQNQKSQDFAASIPMARMGEPDEIGKVVLFLASDLSSYMTGEQIVVDGGALLS